MQTHCIPLWENAAVTNQTSFSSFVPGWWHNRWRHGDEHGCWDGSGGAGDFRSHATAWTPTGGQHTSVQCSNVVCICDSGSVRQYAVVCGVALFSVVLCSFMVWYGVTGESVYSSVVVIVAYCRTVAHCTVLCAARYLYNLMITGPVNPPKFKKYILPTFSREMYKWGSENWYKNHLSIWVSYEKPSSSYCVM